MVKAQAKQKIYKSLSLLTYIMEDEGEEERPKMGVFHQHFFPPKVSVLKAFEKP